MIGKYTIVAKAIAKLDDIQVKHKIGCDGIEIQLYDDVERGELGDSAKCIEYALANVCSVHTPLGDDYFSLESACCNSYYTDKLRTVCAFADTIGALRDKPVLVVLHQEMGNFDICSTNVYFYIKTTLARMLEDYKNIEFGIENLIPAIYEKETGRVTFRNNYATGSAFLVRALREELGTDRIGTVLDTCHAKLSAKIMINIGSLLGFDKMQDFSMDTYFKENADVCKEIHLASSRGFGYKEKEHGTYFDNYQQFEELMDLYEKYNYTCPICVEIREDDYLVCENYVKTVELIKEYVDASVKE